MVDFVRRRLGGPAYSFGVAEPLEVRCLLAAQHGPPEFPPGLADKIDHRVWQAVRGGHRSDVSGLVQTNLTRTDSLGRVQVDILTSADTSVVVGQLAQRGASVTASLRGSGIIQAWVPADQIDDVARLRGVASLRPPDYAVVNVTSAGDSGLKADQVRSRFLDQGIDGTGIKIGVISDGVDHRGNVGAELPSVTVNPDLPGSGDEGTAILEIVHDLAPGAQLFFSGPETSVEMVQSIEYLVDQGCDVIVDDLIFFGESYFSDSEIAQAAQAAVNGGAVYVTSAGNFGDGQHYQAQYLQGGSAGGTARYHRFSTSPNDDFNDVSIPPGGFLYTFLQWSDGWGNSGNNYDLYLTTTSGLMVASSAGVQNGNDLPFEAFGVSNTGGTTFNGQIRIEKRGSAAARELELFIYGHPTLQHSSAGDALVGQEAVTAVVSVATANADSPTSVTAYSSRGGSTIYTNFSTQTKTVRQSLDGTALDGVETRVGELGFFVNPFFGTSAAAPHTAAIAALMLQTDPTLTPAQVAQVMAETATDIHAAGYDTISGAGLYDALDAVYKVFTPDTPDMTAGSDLGVNDGDDLTADDTPTITGTVPAGSFVRLFVDGVQNQMVQLALDATTFNLTTGPLTGGTHEITVRVAADSSVVAANQSEFSLGLSVTIDTIAPSVEPGSFNFDQPPAQSITWVFSESVAGAVQNTDLALFNQTTAVSIPPGSIFADTVSGTTAMFTFPGFPFGALPDGQYTASVGAGLITDLAGNPADIPSLEFFFMNGDASRDGIVDHTDLGILSLNWQQTNRTFTQADFDYDGDVDVDDLDILASRWLTSIFA